MALRTSPLGPMHDERGAKVTEFGGWEMPVEFDSITTEHHAVREAVGKFDVSHMGRIAVDGPDAATLMQRLTTNDVSALSPGEGQYAMITDEEGTILDDTIVYRLPAGERYLFVPNAGHEGEMLDRWRTHRDRWGLEATVEDRTEAQAMVAVQGPEAIDLVASEAAAPNTLRDLGRFGLTTATVAGVEGYVARTGYTGEEGFELIVPAAEAATLWTAMECQPCGLGARDTLRLEMGFLLSGQEFDPKTEPRNPYEAGVERTVALETEFVGRDALRAVADRGVDQLLVGVQLLDRGVPRHGYEVTDEEGRVVGHVTSGTMSPTLEQPIGLAYLPVELADPGTRVRVTIRGQHKHAKVVSTPFIE